MGAMADDPRFRWHPEGHGSCNHGRDSTLLSGDPDAAVTAKSSCLFVATFSKSLLPLSVPHISSAESGGEGTLVTNHYAQIPHDTASLSMLPSHNLKSFSLLRPDSRSDISLRLHGRLLLSKPSLTRVRNGFRFLAFVTL